MGAKLNDCVAHLPAAGGICNAVGLQGPQSAAATISCNKKNVAIWLGSVTLKLNGSPGINLLANNCALIGQTPGSSVLLINSATADAIALNASFVRVEHLAIAVPAGIARTNGAGINVAPAALAAYVYVNDIKAFRTYNGFWISSTKGGGFFTNLECQLFTDPLGVPGGVGGTANSCFKVGPSANGACCITSSTITNLLFSDDWLDGGIVIDSGADSQMFTQLQASCSANSTNIHIKNSVAKGWAPDLIKFSHGVMEACGTGSSIVIDSAADVEFNDVNAGCANFWTCAHDLVVNVDANNIKFRGGDLGGAKNECATINTSGGVDISHTRIVNCSISANNGFPAIAVGAGKSNVRIQDNEFKPLGPQTKLPSSYINIHSGPGDKIFISGNNFDPAGVAGAALVQGATGSSVRVWDNAGAANQNTGPQVFTLGCSGPATAGQTLFLATPGATTAGCTDAGGPPPMVFSSPGTIGNLRCRAGTAGVNSASGIMSFKKNGAAGNPTCTLGLGTSCSDTTHSVHVDAGDSFLLQYSTQRAETLATISCTVEKW